MSDLMHSGNSALPRTYVGRWLRAAMLDQRADRDQLVRTLNRGEATGWNEDEPAVVRAALDLILIRFADPTEIEQLKLVVSQALAADNRPADVAKAETLIGAAVAGRGHDAKEIARMDKFRLRALVVASASMKLQLREADVDVILREAERLAFERGFHPPLVPRGQRAAERP